MDELAVLIGDLGEAVGRDPPGVELLRELLRGVADLGVRPARRQPASAPLASVKWS
jgi:hypothetical protein